MAIDLRRSCIVAALLLFGNGAVGQEGWARYRLIVPDEAAAQRVSDSELALFSDSVALGYTDVIVGPGQFPELWSLRLPYMRIQELPDPRSWADYGLETDNPNYRNQYLRFDQIIAQIEAWRAANPRVISRRQIGLSIQGRPLWAYRVGGPQIPGQPEKVVVVTCLTHAREWITGSVGMHLLYMLSELYRPRPNRPPNVPNVTVWFVPVQNPDGYEYSFTNDRMWRKNRRRNNSTSFGVDLNRNYSVAWGGAGSSGNPSSDVYRGTAPFSEPETAAIRDFCASPAVSKLTAFMDIHSYSQLILYPWSYTSNAIPSGDRTRHISLGNAMRTKILEVYGTPFTVQQGSQLYIASGTSKDWGYGVHGAISYTIELRDTGQYGFLLPENQIAPSQDEFWPAFLEFLRQL